MKQELIAGGLLTLLLAAWGRSRWRIGFALWPPSRDVFFVLVYKPEPSKPSSAPTPGTARRRNGSSTAKAPGTR